MRKKIFHNNSFSTLSRKRIYIILLTLFTFISCSKDESTSTNDDEGFTNDDDGNTDDNDTLDNLSIEFIKVLGGSQNDSFRAVVSTSDGGYAAIGDSQSTDGDITDNDDQINQLWLVKTDQNGTIIFSKTYGGSEDNRATDIITTSDGGYAILGYSESSDGDLTDNNGFYDHWIAKLDSQGTIEWQHNYGFSGSDQANALIQTTDGGFFTAGFLDVTASGGDGNNGFQENNQTTRNTLHGVGEFWGHKLDASGNLVWRRYFGGSNNDRAYDVTNAPDGGILMVGASESADFDISASQGSYDFWAVRIDNSGELLWEKSLGGTEIDIAYAVTNATDGAYIIAGDTRSSDGHITAPRGNADIWLVKLNDEAEIVWQRSLGGSNFDTLRDITNTSNGYVITGASRSSDGQVTENNGQNDFWIATTDTSGNLTDQLVIGGNNQDFGYGVTTDSQGNIIVVGDTASTNGSLTTSNGETDAVLIKIMQ